VEHLAQVQLGRSALILAVRKGSEFTELTARQVYLALARDVPDKTEFRRNTAVRWSDVDKSLPQQDIRFQVPPRDDGNRALFNGLILEGGCRDESLVQTIFSAERRTGRCTTIRVDRIREIPHDQTVQALLDAPEGTIGVVASDDMAKAAGQLVPLKLDGVTPPDEDILNADYEYTTLYYLYAKRGQAMNGRSAAIDTAVDRIVAWALTERVIGRKGLLSQLGLIPLSDRVRAEQRAAFAPRPRDYGIASGASSFATALGSFFNGAGELIQRGLVGNSEESKDGLDFTSLMDIAGYKTEEFQTSVSLIPSAGMTFGLVREMSEADQDYLERKLAQDAHRRTGALATMQRRVVGSVLDVTEANGYEINKVEIEILPLPSVKLIVAPSDGPVSAETTSILHAIEQLNTRITELQQ
jgi:ABC-type phosphate transport system substrate-binding protein